jgi:fatty acid synthase subunit beta
MKYGPSTSDELGGTAFMDGLNSNSSSFTFHNPKGLLFMTQFAQVAIIVMQKAALEDLRSKGLVPDDAYFAGHSLGEYGSLLSVGNILSIEAMTSIVFYRGLIMHAAVERDAAGRTNFAMIAINPKRIHPGILGPISATH